MEQIKYAILVGAILVAAAILAAIQPQLTIAQTPTGNATIGGNLGERIGNATGGNMTGGNMTGGNMTGGNQTGGNQSGGFLGELREGIGNLTGGGQ
jgi:hypothetical protein